MNWTLAAARKLMSSLVCVYESDPLHPPEIDTCCGLRELPFPPYLFPLPILPYSIALHPLSLSSKKNLRSAEVSLFFWSLWQEIEPLLISEVAKKNSSFRRKSPQTFVPFHSHLNSSFHLSVHSLDQKKVTLPLPFHYSVKLHTLNFFLNLPPISKSNKVLESFLKKHHLLSLFNNRQPHPSSPPPTPIPLP